MAVPPPGPTGESQGALNLRYWRRDMYGFLGALAETFGEVVGFDLGHSPCILVNGARQVCELFLKHEPDLRKPDFVRASHCAHWSDGLTTLEAEAWRTRRRMLRPSFTARSLPARLELAAGLAEDMLDGWRPGVPLDPGRAVRLLGARLAARTVLDADLEGCGSAAGRSGTIPVEAAYGEDYTADDMGPLRLTRPRAPRRMEAVLNIIDARIRSGDDRGDVLSALVRAVTPDGIGLTRDEIVGEVMQMLYAGHLTMPFSLVALWRDIAGSEADARIAAEAGQLLVGGGVPKVAALSSSYAAAALKESMRLTPPAPILYREVARPFELDGVAFERGAWVWVSPRLLHRDPRTFPDPERFLPDRFVAARSGGEVPALCIPFGMGPRLCIAGQQAFLQMTLVVLLAARRFALVLSGSPGGAFVVRPRKDFAAGGSALPGHVSWNTARSRGDLP